MPVEVVVCNMKNDSLRQVSDHDYKYCNNVSEPYFWKDREHTATGPSGTWVDWLVKNHKTTLAYAFIRKIICGFKRPRHRLMRVCSEIPKP